MKKNHFLTYGLLLSASAALLLTSLYGCKKDDPKTTATCTSGAFTAQVNGGGSSNLTDLKGSLLGESQGSHNGWRLDIQGNVNGGLLMLAVSNWDFQNPPEGGVVIKKYTTSDDTTDPNVTCKEGDGITYCDGALISFKKNGSSSMYSSEGMGFIEISSCNTAKGTVSGTYEGTLVDYFTDDTLQVKGSFTDVCFADLN